MNQEQRERLAGIAERMRTVGRMAYPNPVWFADYAAEIEACIAEPAEAQPTCRATVTTIVLRECRICGTLTTNEVTRLCEACAAAQAMAARIAHSTLTAMEV